MVDFKLPELGENVTAGDVLRVLVKPGDTLVKDQTVLELETDKATIEVPSSVAGQVKDVKVKAGDKVKVGQTILSVEDDGRQAQGVPGGSSDRTPAPAQGAAVAAQAQPSAAPGAPPANAEPNEPAEEPPVEDRKHAGSPDKQGGTDKVVDINRGARQASEPSDASELPVAPAAPSVRRLARALGVDVNQVAGSGPDGRLS